MLSLFVIFASLDGSNLFEIRPYFYKKTNTKIYFMALHWKEKGTTN